MRRWPATRSSPAATTGGNGEINTVGNTNLIQFGTTTANSYTNVGVTKVGSDGAPSTPSP